jgi:hypothetical protein
MGPYNSDSTFGNKGAFLVPTPYFNKPIFVIASCANEIIPWEHVSASLQKGVQIGMKCAY